MNPAELIELGKRWIEHAPPAKPSAPGLRGFTGPAGFVCSSCCSRISGRGCHLATLATTPVWDVSLASCVLCEPDKTRREALVKAEQDAHENDDLNCGPY